MRTILPLLQWRFECIHCDQIYQLPFNGRDSLVTKIMESPLHILLCHHDLSGGGVILHFSVMQEQVFMSLSLGQIPFQRWVFLDCKIVLFCVFCFWGFWIRFSFWCSLFWGFFIFMQIVLVGFHSCYGSSMVNYGRVEDYLIILIVQFGYGFIVWAGDIGCVRWRTRIVGSIVGRVIVAVSLVIIGII